MFKNILLKNYDIFNNFFLLSSQFLITYFDHNYKNESNKVINTLKALILSHFNQVLGPRIVLKIPESFDNESLNDIPRLLDLYQEGFFVYEKGDLSIANLLFKIQSPKARGGIEVLMISIVIFEEKTDPKFLKNVLEEFVIDAKYIKNVYRSLYSSTGKYDDAKEILEEVREYVFSFYQDLPEETLFSDKNFGITMFGLSGVGKTSIGKFIEKHTEEILPSKNKQIKQLFFENLEITTYNLPIKKKFRMPLNLICKNQDALVFVIDVSEEEMAALAKKELNKIAKYANENNIPFMILINKIDMAPKKIKSIITELEIENLPNHPFKYFKTSVISKEGLKSAFNWLAEIIINRKFSIPVEDWGLF